MTRTIRRAGGLLSLACTFSACNAVLNLDRFEREPRDAGSSLAAAMPTPMPEPIPMPEPDGPRDDAGAGPSVVVQIPTAPEPDAPRGDAGLEPDAAPQTPAPPAARVGSPCANDVDCTTAAPPSLVCFTSASAQFPGIIARGGDERHLGGPAEGYCSRICLSDGECGGGARCLDHEGSARLCLATCSLDASTSQCDSGAPQACVPVVEPDGGACYPLCTRDADCDEGRLCDAASGLCGDALMRGSGRIGAPCTVDSETSDCSSGLCWDPADTGVGVCTALCRAVAGGCGTGDDAAASATACMSDFIGLGAVGSCVRLCDTDADCADDSGCLLGSPVAGRQGYCVPAATLASGFMTPVAPNE